MGSLLENLKGGGRTAKPKGRGVSRSVKGASIMRAKSRYVAKKGGKPGGGR